VHAVGPDVDVVLAGQRSLTPRLVLLLPDGLEPGDGRRRQVSTTLSVRLECVPERS
jgi:hypothetical protein